MAKPTLVKAKPVTTTAAEKAMSRAADFVRDEMTEPQALLDLMRWIENARQVLDEVRFISDHYPEFSEMLQKHAVELNSPDWGPDESQGLVCVHLHVWQRVSETKTSLGQMAKEASHV